MTKGEVTLLFACVGVVISITLSLLYQIANSLEAIVRQLKALRRGDQTTDVQ